MLPTAVALIGSLWLGFSPAHTIGTVVLAFTYSMYSTLRGIQYGALRFRHVAVWDTIAGGVALVAVTVVLTLDLTAFALLPLALGYALFAVVSWPARRLRPGRPRRCAARSTTSSCSVPSAGSPAAACSSSPSSPRTPTPGRARPATSRRR